MEVGLAFEHEHGGTHVSDAAITVIMAGVIQVVVLVVGFLTMWVKLRYANEQAEAAAANAELAAVKAKAVEDKIDDNTKITKESAAAAVQRADTAVVAATTTKAAVDVIGKKLNGGIDEAITTAVTPLHAAVANLERYVHDRNHDLLTSLQLQSNRIEAILMMVKNLQEARLG